MRVGPAPGAGGMEEAKKVKASPKESEPLLSLQLICVTGVFVCSKRPDRIN